MRSLFCLKEEEEGEKAKALRMKWWMIQIKQSANKSEKREREGGG